MSVENHNLNRHFPKKNALGHEHLWDPCSMPQSIHNQICRADSVFLQSAIDKATSGTLIEANKILHEAKRHKEANIRIQPIEYNQIRFLAFSNASFSSPKQAWLSHWYDNHDYTCK